MVTKAAKATAARLAAFSRHTNIPPGERSASATARDRIVNRVPGRARLSALHGDDAYALVAYYRSGAERVGPVVEHEPVAGYPTQSWCGFLRVGCEMHRFADWVRFADLIDQRHGTLGHDKATRALARKLLAAERRAKARAKARRAA